MSQAPRPKPVTEFVDALVSLGVRELVRLPSVTEEQARAAMSRVADGLLHHYARTSMYVPVGFSQRNAEIVRRYGAQGEGNSPPYSQARVRELAAEYELTERQIYSIVAAARSAEFSARQGDLGL